MNRIFQPHESHIPYLLQLLVRSKLSAVTFLQHHPRLLEWGRNEGFQMVNLKTLVIAIISLALRKIVCLLLLFSQICRSKVLNGPIEWLSKLKEPRTWCSSEMVTLLLFLF